MTQVQTSLDTVLRRFEPTAHERKLLLHCADVRQRAAGEEFSHFRDSLLILIRGKLSVAHPLKLDKEARASSGQAIRIVFEDVPVLVLPPSSVVRPETEIEIIEIKASDCAFLMATCRAFRALLFAASQAGVSQILQADQAHQPRALNSISKLVRPRLLH